MSTSNVAPGDERLGAITDMSATKWKRTSDKLFGGILLQSVEIGFGKVYRLAKAVRLHRLRTLFRLRKWGKAD
ncbi:MAG: hypothetical protein NXI22_20865 [bacterium]|nr:hypothetical protein [bacterium]